MRFDLQPLTDPGRQLVALAEAHIEMLASRAALHDREVSFPVENIAALQSSGFLAACVPRDFGGLGVASIHDAMVAISRLGRGDGSTAIATNMHTFIVFLLARFWTADVASGNSERAAPLAEMLAAVARNEAIFCTLPTESGTDLLHPRTTATPTEGGWLLNGRKSFATMSAWATHGNVTFRLVDREGVAHVAFAILPTARPGLAVQHNWDALGMRASGSHDIVLTDCFVPEADVTLLGPYGELAEWYIANNMIINFGLVGSFLGIAEAARDLALGLVTSRRRGSGQPLAESPSVQHTVAEIEIDLAACRALLTRTAVAADSFFGTHPPGAVPMDELHELNKEFQCTKWVVNRKAIAIVDRALQLSGGSGYLSSSPLSRLYRDVRAGPFMQVFSPHEAFPYIGKVALGLDPRVE